MVLKIIVNIIILLFISCDDNLEMLPSLDYYCPVEDFQLSMYDCNSYELSWEYDINQNNNCFENAFKFEIYGGEDENNINQFIAELSINPSISNLEQYYLDDFGRYYFLTENYDNFDSVNYFSIIAVYDSDVSSDNPIQSLPLSCGGPDLNIVEGQCGEGYDNDCQLINISHNSFGASNIAGALVYRIIENSDEEQVNITVIDTLLDDSPIQDKFHLELCSQSNVVSMSSFVIDLEKDYCNEVYPNQNYKLKYYYESNGVQSDVASIDKAINFNRNNANISSKAYSSSKSRIYIPDNVDLSNYNQILFFKNNIQNDFSNPSYIINNPSYMNNNFESNNIFDIEIIDDDYFVLFVGNYSMEFSDNLYYLETLNDYLDGFILIENNNSISNVNSGDDFYISKYEVSVTSSILPINQTLGSIPSEINCSGAEQYILDLQNELMLNGILVNLSLPTTDEWEHVASYNIFTNEITLYPWGNQIDAYHANYLNSDLPSNATGLVGVGLHNWPSAYGVYDLAGNVMEWTKNNNFCIGKGGNYLSTADDLLISTDHNQIPEEATLGMGFRIIMK
tara:strand:- start:364 stop:2061 length:1698 start_codon:yes stop_codon:yes gene_type:complete